MLYYFIHDLTDKLSSPHFNTQTNLCANILSPPIKYLQSHNERLFLMTCRAIFLLLSKHSFIFKRKTYIYPTLIFKVFIPGNLISKKWMAIYFSFFTLQRIESKCQKTQNRSLGKRYLAAVRILEGNKAGKKTSEQSAAFLARRIK